MALQPAATSTPRQPQIFGGNEQRPDGLEPRKKLYTSIEELQADVDAWLVFYNSARMHQGKMCCGRTSMAILEAGKQLWQEKNLSQI